MKRRLGILLTLVLLAGMVLITPVARGAEASGEARMLSFTLAGCEGRISESAGSIAVTMNAQADLGGLIARFTASPNARVYVDGVQQSSGSTANDFSEPVKYTVVSQDERTKKTYTVRVSVKSGGSELLSFKVGGATGKIDQTNRAVSVSLSGGNVGSLAPEFKVSSGATLRLGSSGGPVVKSKETKVNFSSAVDFYVVAANGSFTQYTVTVKSAKADLRFTAFTLGGYEGVIDASSRVITVNLPSGAGRSNLVATFKTSPDCRVCVGGRKGTVQRSGSTANDFNAPVKYYLVDEKNDENYGVYTVNVVVTKASTLSDEVSAPKDAKVVSVMPARLELGKRYAWRPSVAGTIVSVSNKSSNTSVVSVEDGGYNARKEGTATLTTIVSYRNSGGKTRSKTVTQKVKVVTPVTKVELSSTQATVKVGGTVTLSAQVSPSSATDPELTWTSSSASVAKVDAGGKVTGLKKGSCTITCTSLDGAKAACRVTVN